MRKFGYTLLQINRLITFNNTERELGTINYLCAMKNMLTNLFAGQQYDSTNFFLIAGPCVVESEELLMEVGDKVS